MLSNGHGCALQYSLLHLYGYDVPMEEVKLFRQLDSMSVVLLSKSPLSFIPF